MSNSRVTAALEARKRRNEEASKTSNSNNSSTRNRGNNSTVNSNATNSKVADALKARQVRIKNEIPNTLASIQKQYNSLVTNYNSASPSFGEGAYKDTVIKQREARVQLSDLERKIDAYRSYMDEGTADSLLSNLSQMRSGYDAYVYMSRFKSQDEYKKSIMTVDEIDKAIANAEKALEMSYKTDINRAVKTNQNSFSPVPAQSSENTKSLENEIEELKAWRTVALQNDEARKNAELFETYRNDKDFQTNAASGLEAFNNSKLAEKEESENRSWWENAMINMGNAGKSEITLAMDAYRDDTSYREPQDNWTQEQKDMFGYLYNKDPNTAFEYATNVNNAISAEEANKQREKIRELATKSPIIHTIGSVAVSPLGLADYLDNLVEYAARGTIADKDYVTPYDYSQEVRGAISNDLNTKYGTLNEEIPVIGGKGLGDVYGLGTSIADSALSTYTGGSIGPLVTFFGSAAASAVDDAKQRGASDDQALVIGALSGLAEGLAEQIGAEKLLNIGSSHTMRELLLNLAKQGVSEGLEEGTTTLLNNFADQLVLQDKSNFNALVSYYVTEEHLSADEAKKKAWASMAEDLAYDMLGGFVSGAVHAGPQTAVQTIIGNVQAKSLYGESQQELVEQGLQSTPGSLSRTLAMQYQEKLENGGNLTGGQLSRLVEANEQQIRSEDIYNIQRAVQARLTELGETGDIASISYAIARQVAGESLTSSDRKALKNSKYGEQVANELDKANINSGKYSAEWAQKIGTNRINAEEYSLLVQDAQIEQESAGETEDTNDVAADVPEITYASTDDAKQNTDMNAQSVTEMDMEEESNTKEDSKKTVTIEDVSKKYGAQAPAVMSTYQQGQDVEKFDAAYQIAYNMGKSGVSIRYAKNSDAVSYLTDKQIDIAYNTGKDAAAAEANVRDTQNKSATNGKTGRKKGVVRGEGVTISDLKQTFNDTQGKAYKYLSTVAEVTGIDIVLYRSDAGPDGKFQGAQGRYSRSEPGTIYIDLNAGLSDIKSADDLAKYAMLRTFAHEFTHFIEKWNPVQYNEFRKVVFNTLSERGENVNDLIEEKQARNPGMSYDKASREVVSEAMTDILPDANFVQELAQKHQAIFQKLLEKLKEFVSNLREYFESIGNNPSREANALKEQIGETAKYLDSIVQMFDKIAVQAVENYQMTVAVEEVVQEDNSESNQHGALKKKYGLTDGELYSIISYKSGESYKINAMLREGTRLEDLSKADQEFVKNLDSALAKLPVFKGQIYRNLSFDDFGGKEEYDKFIAAHAKDYTIVYEAYTSTSTKADGYPVDGEYVAHLIIPESAHAHDMSGIGNNFESEALYERGVVFNVSRVVFDSNGVPTIYLKEDVANEAGEHGQLHSEKRSEAVQPVLPEEQGNRNLPSVSEADTPRSAGGELSEVQTGAEVSDAYTSLGEQLKQYTHVDIDGVRYSAKAKREGGYYGNIKQLPAKAGGVPVENARGTIYSSYTPGFETREEAISDLVAVARNNKLLGEVQATENTKEVTSNGKESENGPDTGAVQQPVRSGEEASRLLEGVEPEAVQSGSEGRGSVRAGIDEGREDAGRDEQPDAAGPVSERSARDSVGGDLQQLSELNDKSDEGAVVENRAEALHEEVQQQIAKKSTTQPKGSNFVIGESLDLPNGTKARTRANIEAIKLVKQIAAEGRAATAAEQEILSKYVGWGGLADAFGKPVSNRETRRIEYEAVSGLEAEFEELKSVLTEEEYKSARESTKNAHYTSIEVIKAMYDGLKHLGFKGGRMLEPSSGVGNFVGAMPADMSAQVKSWTMVELDNITGLFAKYLYPNADVRIQGFEETNIPDGYMDVAIGNVPFGKYPITDKHYPKSVTGAIHNYFFAKSLDKVRPGGIVMFITSAYTMNASDSAVRKYIMQRADLLGAIRLPNTAFSGNAGTSVVTDILILKKRAERTEYSGEAFETSSWERIGTTGYYDGAYVNEYFVKHPEMVLGIPKMARGMYSSNELTYEPFTDRGSLGDQIREAMQNISGKMDYSTQLSAEKANFRQASAKKKSQRLQVKNGVIQQRDENGNLTNVEVDADTAARITGMVAIRDAHTALCDALQQGVNKKESNSLRKALNNAYDSFVKKYGYLNSPKNKKAIKSFSDSYSILSLENYSTEGKKVSVTKADIFSKDTIAANRSAAMAENVEEGLTISLNTTGAVDVSMISRLTGEHVDSVTRQLIDQRLVFKDKDGNLIPAVQYLSGNVRAKLREMEGLTGIDRDYQNNVEALRAIVPPTVEYTDIYVNPGANWVPVSVYEDFVSHILSRRNSENYRTGKKDFSVEYVPETNEYKVSINDTYAKMSAQNTQVWGEGGKAFSTIFENMLNGRRTNVYMEGPDGKRVLDKVKTEAVAEKVEKLNEEFRKWLWSDEARRADMQELYNEAYNALVTPKYSGKNLTVNGLNSTYSLREHQADAVSRIINSGGNTLLAHRVGAGKTLEMAAAAMKLKQLGIIKKPMFVVPNNVVSQWGEEFKDYFPAANILLVGDDDMTPAERMTTINKIKNNDYDAVILAYTKFEKIQMTKAWRQKFYEEQIDGIMFAINAEKESQGKKGFSVKQLEAKRKQLEAKLKKLTDKAKDEDGAMFEDLGVDSLFVDEAHNFKNLEYTTRMNNVSGLGKADGSQRAFDLYTKVRYLQQLNGGRGIVFATATPVMNSMTEMYIMQRYLQPDTLKHLGIDNFDSWAKMFGEVVNALEIAPSGSGYRLKQTFSKFKNIKALQQLFRSFTDVVTDIPGLKIPKMKGGKVQIVECEQGEFQKNYMEELAKRAENVKNVDPSEDNMLKITSDGRKISYSQRMIDPSLPYEEGGKIYKCCDNVYSVYKESNNTNGTQMIFCDMATPKGKTISNTDSDTNTDEFSSVDTESAQLYDDIKARLIQLGIPANEIAFIHDAKNDKQKAALSEKMNKGKIRVLIGSTGKMGVGLNAQVKAVAIHHLDAPWRPGDIEQRDGRVFRQKNENQEAYKFVYVTKGSFDSRLWDILERKQKFINQIMNGDDVGNEVEDTGEVTLSAAEVKAVASGSPLIMEQVALEKEISKLESLLQAHTAGVNRAEQMIITDERRIASLEKRISDVSEDINNRKDTYSSDQVFSIKIGQQTFTDKKEAGTALVAAAQAKAKEGNYTAIGSFAGFTLRVVKTKEGISGIVSGAGSYEFKVYPLNPTYGINHLIAVVESFEENLSRWNKNLSETRIDLETQKQLAAEPFAQSDKLKEKRARYNEVMYILNPPADLNLSDDMVQEQSREYLDSNDTLENAPVTQAISSAKTSIKQIPALFKDKNVHFEETNVDIGGGRFDLATEFLAEQGVKNYLFDPYNRPENVNMSTLNFLRSGNRADTATCANVLNVIAEPSARANVILEAAKSIKNDGTAYFMVYEGDGSGVGRETSSGWQNNRKTADYVGEIAQYFNSVVRKGKLIIAADPVSNLPKASWEISPGNAIQYQQRTNTLTDREVLQYAANEINTADLTDGEKDALRIFNARLTKLEQLQEQRTELGTLYKQQQFEPGSDRSKAAETLNRMHVLDEQIKTASEAVLSVEDKAVLKRVLQKARKVVEQQERAKGQEALRRWRDRRNNAAAIKKYRDRLRGDVDELTNWVLHPDNKNVVKHIPDALKNAVVPFLSSINFMSKQQLRGGNPTAADKALMEQARKLAKVMESAVNVDEMYSNYTDLPPDFMQNLRNFMDTAQAIVDNNSGDFIINQMTSDELKELSKVVRTLKKYIMDMNRFHVNAMFQHVYEAGDNSIEFLSQLKPAENTGSVSQFLLWQQMRPAYAFERFGEGGKAIYDGLRRGQATLAFNTKKIQEFTEKAYTTAEVTAWEKQVKTIRIAPGKVVTMRVSQIMSLYELNKREQARGHILGEGIRVATFKNGRKKISDVGQTLTPGELNLILRELTPRQKEVADKLQQFMQKQGGAWGNYVTVARFGEKQFGEENYFPINSDGRHLSVNADEKPGAAALYALLNMGFTKQTQEKAKNRIVVYSIFDVFANHMASMAQYNAFALPVVDALKWFNYQQVDVDEDGTKTILGSVREQMDRAFGVPEESRPGSGNRGYAQNFVINIIKAFNGTEAQGTPYDSFGMQALHHYNRAQIAYNFRVVVQQPLAITRAAMLLDYTSIIRGMKLAPSTIQKNIQEMQKYSGIAAWKSLGFYDVNISRGLTSLIKHDNTAIDKITDIGMWGAEKADTITWSAIWSACKEEVIRKQKLRPDSAGFYDAVTKLFEDVIYKTQVVDSVLTKNEFMRDKGFFARALGSFMSEATTTASMLVDAYDKYQMDLQRGMTRQQAWKKNRRMIVRTAYVFGIGAAILAAVQAVADALRDDDDYETFLEKWLEAFGGNVIDELMPFNKLPILSDFYDLAKEILSVFGVDTYGNPPQSVFMQWYDSLVNGVEIIYGKITGEEDRYTWYAGAYKLLQAASGIFGFPMATATREIITAWNNIVGSMAPSLKVKTYDSGAKNEIKYAYQDGYLTAEEAAEQLLQHGVVDTEDEAYWTIQGWEAGDGYSKYNAIYDAVRNGSSIDDAMDELTSHGYSEKDVLSQVKSQIGEWYKTGEITKQQAINMLTEYMDMDTDDITATVNKWSSVVVTGIAYEDIKDEYLAGNITEGRAIDMYVRYGGYSEEKAAETVTKWRSEKETGIAYDDLEESFMDGDITSDQLKSMYIEYGGMNDEEAAEKVTVLAFVKEHPETDGISYAAVDNYNTYCKSSGVSAEIFYDAWQYNSSTKADVDENGESISGSKKTKVLDYINTLDLTYDQKDALYYAFGWAESRIYEAPWH